MIVDCHAHIFENWQGAGGHPSRAVHLKYLQKVVTRPAARTFRVRDGREIKPTMLFRPDDNTWAGLTQVDFRAGRFGQLSFTYEGEDHYVQYLPVGMQELACPPELMLSQMTYAGVDHCILQAGGGYGAMNDYNAYAQHQWPQKFSGLLHIDEGLADRADTQAEVDRAVEVLGLCGLYYAQDFSRHGYARNVNHPAFETFWDKVVAYRLPVFIELSSTPSYDRAGYLANLSALGELLVRYPTHRFLLVMGRPPATSLLPAAGNFRRKRSRSTNAPICRWRSCFPSRGAASGITRTQRRSNSFAVCATPSVLRSSCGARTCPTSSVSAPTDSPSTM
jgi:hypothetical protein